MKVGKAMKINDDLSGLIYEVTNGILSNDCYEFETIIKVFKEQYIERSALDGLIEDILFNLEDGTTDKEKIEFILSWLRHNAGKTYEGWMKK